MLSCLQIWLAIFSVFICLLLYLLVFQLVENHKQGSKKSIDDDEKMVSNVLK